MMSLWRSKSPTVTHAPRAGRDSGDNEIVRMLVVDPEPGSIRVVTSDHWLSDRAYAAGASVEPARAFRELIEPG